MIAVQIDTGEFDSVRFSRLCDRLQHNRTKGEMMKVWGHLTLWYVTWARDREMDCGLFWNICESDLGRWADWPQCLQFGRALVAAGYVQPIEERFPDQKLTKGRRGFVVISADGEIALDKSWGWHKNRARKEENCLFLTDRAMRSRWAAHYGVNPDSAPAGWLDVSPASALAPPGGDPPGGYGQNSGTPPGGVPPAPRSPYVDGRKEGTEFKRRNEAERTGRQKSWELFEELRTLKNDDILAALITLDASPDSQRLANEIVRQDPSFAFEIISRITETQAAWAAIRTTPAAIVFSSIRTRLRSLERLRRSTNHPSGGQGGTLRVIGTAHG